MSKDTISVNMNVYDIPILVEQLEKANREIERLKEEYMILQNASDEVEEEKDKEIERLNNIINELDKQNGELGANLSLIEDKINKTNWWLENMLKQAKNMETRAIISGTLELLLGSDKE